MDRVTTIKNTSNEDREKFLQVVAKESHDIWSTIMDSSQNIVKAVEDFNFDFDLLENEYNDPTLGAVVNHLKTLARVLDFVVVYYEMLESPSKLDMSRRLLNAKQTVLHLECLLTAIRGNDRESCHGIWVLLKNQSKV